MSRGVVITGMGILSSAGPNLAAARGRFLAGACCLTPIAQARAARLRAKFAGQIPNFQPGAELPSHDRHVHLALAAAREALAAAGQPAHFGRRLGLIFSTCSGPMLLIEDHYERILRGQPRLTAEELFARRYFSGAPALAQALGISGFCTTVVTACSASTAAMAVAADLIRCGMLDAALAGGADSFSASTLAGFDGLKATSEGRCAPFSKPPGLNLGEAAAFVFLESAESARQRGATPRAAMLGSGLSNDAHHCSAPEPGGRGLAEAMRRALADAGLAAEQISYLNAHGTGTEANDKAECKAMRKVFGDRMATLPVSSTKSMVGHCLGAAGAVEVIASIVCAEAGVLPPTANFAGPREGCVLDCVPEAGRAWSGPKIFLSNNSAFGGQNTSLALGVGSAECRVQSAECRVQSAECRVQSAELGRGEAEHSTFNLQPSTSEKESGEGRRESRERVFIMACGVVSAAGMGVETLERARFEGRSGLCSITLPDLPPLLAGRVDETAAAAFDRRLDLRPMDAASKWATLAARLAIRAAGFPEAPAALAELGLLLNLSAGPSWAESEFLTSFLGNDHQVAQLSAFPYIVPSSVAGNVCRALRFSGHNLTLNPGPAAGLFGLAPAVAALRCGHAGAILCGAVDELSDRILADSYWAGQVAGHEPPGEGAAIYLLETAPHALARNARPLAEIRGLTSITKPSLSHDDIQEIIAAALSEAQVRPGQISGVCHYGKSETLPPEWREILIQTQATTGRLEGAQPLLDLAVALRSPLAPASGHVLSLAVTPHGMAAAAVCRRC